MPMKKGTRRAIRKVTQFVLTSSPLTRSTYKAIKTHKSDKKSAAKRAYGTKNIGSGKITAIPRPRRK